MKRSAWILAVLIVMLWPVLTSNAQTTKGAVVFEDHCATCHGNPSSATPAPDFMSLWKLTAEQVYAALGKAPHTSLTGHHDEDWREVAFYLGRRRVDIGKITDAKLMPNPCPGNSPLGNISSKPMWNGWGNGISNARFQSAKDAGLTASQVPKLKLKWAFGFPGADEVYGQPTVAGGRVFLGVGYRRGLFPRRGKRMRLLVLSGRRGRAHCDQHRPRERKRRYQIRRLLW